MILKQTGCIDIHPSMNNYTNALANGLAWYYARQNKPFIFPTKDYAELWVMKDLGFAFLLVLGATSPASYLIPFNKS